MNRKQTDFIKLNNHDVQDNGINDFRHYFGRILRKIRKQKDLTPDVIGHKMGINPQTVYGYERGLYLPKLDQLRNLTHILNLTEMFIDQIRECYANNIPVEQCVSNILSGTEIQKDESDLDDLLIRTLQINLKNLSEPEKIILLRHIVNFTTEKVKKEYFHV